MDSIDFPFLEKTAEFLKADESDRSMLLTGALGLPCESQHKDRVYAIGAALRGKQDEVVVPQADWKDVIEKYKCWNLSPGIKKAIKKDDPAYDNNWPIQWAARNGYIELVRCLLSDSRVDPGDDDQCALREAAVNLHIDIARLLLQDPRVSLDAAIAYAESGGWFRTYTALKELKE